jgi:flagellar basal-body rod protein FlgF
MAGGYYIALTGLHARLERLDRLAADLANSSTVGYKGVRSTTAQADRPEPSQFGAALKSAIDVVEGPTKVDLRGGTIAPTGRELDMALDGPGLFAVQTPSGSRYTRDGRFLRSNEGTLVTSSGDPVLGSDGGTITLGTGAVSVDHDGSLRAGNAVVGKLQIVEFSDGSALVPESADRYRAASNARSAPASRTEVRQAALEQSNVSVMERIAEMTSNSRSFESLQRALSLLSNDVDGRAISELGRR